VQLKKSATETFDIIRETYKDEAISITYVFKWNKQLKIGWENVKNEKHA